MVPRSHDAVHTPNNGKLGRRPVAMMGNSACAMRTDDEAMSVSWITHVVVVRGLVALPQLGRPTFQKPLDEVIISLPAATLPDCSEL